MKRYIAVQNDSTFTHRGLFSSREEAESYIQRCSNCSVHEITLPDKFSDLKIGDKFKFLSKISNVWVNENLQPIKYEEVPQNIIYTYLALDEGSQLIYLKGILSVIVIKRGNYSIEKID